MTNQAEREQTEEQYLELAEAILNKDFEQSPNFSTAEVKEALVIAAGKGEIPDNNLAPLINRMRILFNEGFPMTRVGEIIDFMQKLEL